MTEDEIFQKTNANYLGNWEVTKEKTDIKLSISWFNGTNNVRLKINGQDEQFESGAHWFGGYLMFMDGFTYYIRYADEHRLIFGKNKGTALLDDISWEYELYRVA